MANIVIYTKSYCPYSKECKEMLDGKGVKYEEKVIDNDVELQKEMEMKADNRTDTPQVFINGSYIGSGDDLKALESTEKLDEMLNS